MKRWMYAAGLALIPVAYIGVSLSNGDPIQWLQLFLIAVFLSPLYFFSKVINRIPGEVMAKAKVLEVVVPPQGPEVPPTSRVIGLWMLLLGALVWCAEYVLAHVVFVFFPLLFLPSGVLLAVGLLVVIHPVFFDAVVRNDRAKYHSILRGVTYATIIAGLILGMVMMHAMRGS